MSPSVGVGMAGMVVAGIADGGTMGRVGGADVGRLQARVARVRERKNIQ